MTPEQQAAIRSAAQRAAITRAASRDAGARRGEGFLPEVNAGIADTIGGAIDFANPFDNEVWGEVAGGRLQTGSAKEGLRAAMGAVGADVATGEPDTLVEGLGRGAGNAAGALLPVAKGLQLLGQARGAPQAVRAFANDAYKALAGVGGTATEIAAGGVGGAAGRVADEAGAPEWVQSTAEMAAPAVALPAAAGAVRAAGRGAARVAEALPAVGTMVRAGRDLRRAVLPMTEGGAREVARGRLRDLAGGDERAAQLADMIDPKDEFTRTPAQQTGDPNLIGLEREVSSANPVTRERLADRRVQSVEALGAGLDRMGGNVGDARGFFETRLRDFRAKMGDAIEREVSLADRETADLTRTGPEGSVSSRAASRLGAALDEQLARERELWGAIPRDAEMPTSETLRAIQGVTESTSWAQRRDIGVDLQAIADGNSPIGESTNVRELHGLYSELRRVARNAMAGPQQNRNSARVANDVAEAILQDLSAVDGGTPIGQQIAEARAFSRALHETFDTGAVGRILQRTVDGDQRIAPEGALKRTVGRGGPEGRADARSIEAAAPAASQDVQEFLRGRFADTLLDAGGKLTAPRARTWMRNNRETLARYPGLRKDMATALRGQDAAQSFAVRAEARAKLADRGATSRFNQGQADNAFTTIFGADNPTQTAATLANTARKDKSGKAMAGLKASAIDFLTDGARSGGATNGGRMLALLRSDKTRPALRRIFPQNEFKRLERIASAFQSVDARGADVGEIINSPANQLIEYVVRIVAAQQGGKMGGGTTGGSLQAANIVTERARKMLANLTNDKARQLLVDAVEDAALFRDLLREPEAIARVKASRDRLTPYLTAGAAQFEGDG